MPVCLMNARFLTFARSKQESTTLFLTGNVTLGFFCFLYEVVYPRVNNFSILILFLSYLFLILSLISEFGGGTGWTLYPPLSTSFMSLSPSSTGNLIFGLLISGISVITNLLSSFPSLIEWVSGGHYVYNPTLKRFFLFHFQIGRAHV